MVALTIAQIKAEARKAAFARRKIAFDLGQGAAAGYLSEVLAGYRGVPVAGYMAMRTEIDPTSAMEEAAAHGDVGVPVIMGAGQALKFRQWSPGCQMIDGAFGAQIPETGDWMTPEIVIDFGSIAGKPTDIGRWICLRCARGADIAVRADGPAIGHDRHGNRRDPALGEFSLADQWTRP